MVIIEKLPPEKGSTNTSDYEIGIGKIHHVGREDVLLEILDKNELSFYTSYIMNFQKLS